MDSALWSQVVLVKNMEEEEGRRGSIERKAKPGKDQILNCPRCNSTNTKFCYYNNYSLSQPRYFCKSCRRYWTAGGSLRNIPVGGASRKNKKSTLSSSISTSCSSSSSSLLSDQMDQMLKSGISSRELIPFMPMPAAASAAGDYNPNLHELKPTFNLSLDDHDHGFESGMEDHFKQVPIMNSEPHDHQNGGKLGDVTGFWNGIFGGGSSW